MGKTILAGFALAVLLAAPARADVITLRADEWCPYNCAEGSDMPGYGIEVATEIFAKAGHTLEYGNMAWARALEECRKGTVMAVIGAAKKEVPDFVFPEETIAVADNSFVVKKGSPWRYEGPQSLEGIKLGVIRGYSYDGEVGDYVETNRRNPRRIDVVGGEGALDMNLKKLNAGRVAATVDAGPVLAYKMKQLGFTDRMQFVGSVDPSLTYIAFSPANPKSREYADILDKGLAEMRASGRLKQILDRYGVPDWK